jgi:transposase
LKSLLSLSILGNIDLRFADESAFNLEPNVPYGWIRVGEQYGLRSSKGGKLNVFGLLNYSGDLSSFVTTGRVDSTQIIEWMTEFATTIDKRTVVVLDNAPWHSSKLVMDKIGEWKEMGLELFYLPPYCPHLNIIETLWRKMKHEWLRPKDFNNVEALHDRIKDILTNYGNGLFDIDFSL